jgi:hypothetical protein
MTQTRNFNMAMEEFKTVIKTANKTEAVAHAMYRISDLHILNQRFEEAKDALRDLIKKYPNLELSKSAELKLKLMEQETRDIREAERAKYKRKGIKESNINDVTERSVFDEVDQSVESEENLDSIEELQKQILFSEGEAYEGDDYKALLKKSIDRGKDRAKAQAQAMSQSQFQSQSAKAEELFPTRKKPVFAHHTRRVAPPPIPADLFRKRQPYSGEKQLDSNNSEN